ncbi:MAG: hypothetical protein D6707_11130, partial [Bacteroidetes bacterium]
FYMIGYSQKPNGPKSIYTVKAGDWGQSKYTSSLKYRNDVSPKSALWYGKKIAVLAVVDKRPAVFLVNPKDGKEISRYVFEWPDNISFPVYTSFKQTDKQKINKKLLPATSLIAKDFIEYNNVFYITGYTLEKNMKYAIFVLKLENKEE